MRYIIFFLIISWNWIHAQTKETPYVLLISFDGFRHDYVANYSLKNFQSFIKQGASSEGLIPSFPSKTFPNHYTLVTGLYPGNHGLVDNAFYDKKKNVKFSLDGNAQVIDPDFYGGTPLWQLAQQHGLPSASSFWVGSEAPVHGVYPTYHFPYKKDFPDGEQINRAIAWLELPDNERPHFISIYFDLVDTQGHTTGPNSPELRTTLHYVDSLLGQLMKRLQKINLPVNVILVSDHGMMELNQEKETWITLSELINTSDSSLLVVNNGTHAHIYSSRSDSLYSILKKKEQNFKVYKKNETPAKWHYNHERVGDLLIFADLGYQLQGTYRERDYSSLPKVFGAHGFDPSASRDLNGIFYAAGPNIIPGKRLPAFENIHVYPFIAKILDLPIPKIDGDVKVLESVYRK